ncbi:MAG: glycosyltransferase [Chloroflexi bacterium]|nr:glycosyltransferase [Chloroflexota bacterium]
MRVLFHVTMPPSPMAACDAVIQEIEAIRSQIPGEIFHLYPAQVPGTRFPRRFWGLQHLLWLRLAERSVTLHHVFNPDCYLFHVLKFLRRPIIYTAVTGVRGENPAMAQALARKVQMLAVPMQTDLEQLRRWRITNAMVIPAGIDVTDFESLPLPPGTPPTLLIGSAPWTEEQFRTKGVDVLLEVAKRLPNLHLIFLWRGVLEAEMYRRVAASGVRDRIEVINTQVDVNRVLARVHASIALASNDTLIKAQPQSLLESLAAGKPVLLNELIPMAEKVKRDHCGVVIETVTPEAVMQAVNHLFANYDDYHNGALIAGQSIFNRRQMVAAYVELYQGVKPLLRQA